ncbi:MAG TPA: glycosyltransferase family 4 protein [Vicinamibacterales bacterium]|nr:glycosyltransferase family 4 protein [Vicinamibacterales bacterium]
MLIVHVTPHLPPDQAANAILPALAGEWSRARGHEVSYVAHPPAQGGDVQTPAAGPVEWVPRRQDVSGLSRFLRIDAIRRRQSIRATLDRVAGDAHLLHLHSNGLLVEVAAQWAKSRRIPYVLTLYGTEIWHYQKRRPVDFFARAYHGAALVTFYSKGLMARAIQLGLNRPNLLVVYPAVPLSFDVRDEHTRTTWRKSLGIGEPRLIVNVKRLHELAGQTYLLDAFALVRRARQDVRLVICGTGSLREALEAQAASLGIADAVTFAGLVSNDQVARYTAAADVFALPSLLEALPTVAVEALASGTPVVSADHPGGVELQRVFGDDVAVVPKRDAAALARALTEALDSGRRARSSTHDLLTLLFRPDAIAKQYESIYHQVARRK